jgi:hypothetical protein
MNYLHDQAVMNFAGTAARGSAIGTAVAEGMVSYLADSNAVEVYDGSAWKQVYPAVDVPTAGQIVQVVSATKTDTAVTTSASFADITGLSVSITPKSATNKIIITANVMIGANGDQWAKVKIVRDSTDVATFASSRFGDVAWNFQSSGTFLDSPATTSATTYKLQWANQIGANSTYINRRGFDTGVQGFSSITVMEVVA